jgi:tRNA(Glu) U13 pseudouridine synthase TruD
LRIKTNDELNNLIRKKDIINYIKAQRWSRFGHANQMTKDSIVTKLYEWKLISTGRPKIRLKAI